MAKFRTLVLSFVTACLLGSSSDVIGMKVDDGGLPTLTILGETEGLAADGTTALRDNCTLYPDTGRKCKISFTTTAERTNLETEVKCAAGYPVTWSLDSIEKHGFVRTSSRRELNLSVVHSSGNLTSAVTAYSMSLYLTHNHEQMSSALDANGEANMVFVCGPVQDGNGEPSRTISTELTLKRTDGHTEPTFTASFRLVEETREQVLDQQKQWSMLNRRQINDPRVQLEFVPSSKPVPYGDSSQAGVRVNRDDLPAPAKNYCTLRCCLAPRALADSTAKDIRIWVGICSHPLACAIGYGKRPKTKTGGDEFDKGLIRLKDLTQDLSGEGELELDEEARCSTWTKDVPCPGQESYVGQMVMCDVEDEVKVKVKTEPTLPPPPLAISYLINGGDRTEILYASAWNETIGLTRVWERTVVKPNTELVHIHVGDTLLLECAPNQFTYDQTIVWELVYENGTRSFNVSQSTFRAWYLDEQVHQLKVPIVSAPADVVTVICHSAPWASTAWVSKSVHIVAKPSSPPTWVGPPASVFPENVTFYSSETIQLQCEDLFSADPPPQLEWTFGPGSDVTSVYAMTQQTDAYGSGSKVEIFVWAHHLFDLELGFDELDGRPPVQLPPVQVICTATNPAGTATHVFHVQALRELSPVMRNAARHAVAVREGETGVLNCTLAQAVPPADYYWQRNGENVTRKVTVNGSSWSALILDSVNFEDEAEYECVAVNRQGRASKEFSVRVRDRIHEHAHAHTEAHGGTTTTGSGSNNWIIIVVVLTISALIPLGFLIHYLKEKNFFSRLSLSLSPSVAWNRFGLNRAESTVTVNTGVDMGAGSSSSSPGTGQEV